MNIIKYIRSVIDGEQYYVLVFKNKPGLNNVYPYIQPSSRGKQPGVLTINFQQGVNPNTTSLLRVFPSVYVSNDGVGFGLECINGPIVVPDSDYTIDFACSPCSDYSGYIYNTG